MEIALGRQEQLEARAQDAVVVGEQYVNRFGHGRRLLRQMNPSAAR